MIPSCRCLGCNTPIDQLYAKRKDFPAMYGKVLLACTRHQAALLVQLWADTLPISEPVVQFWIHIAKTGQFPDFLDRENPARVTDAFANVISINN
jgi:hypothetical protein